MAGYPISRRTFIGDLVSAATLFWAGGGITGCREDKYHQSPGVEEEPLARSKQRENIPEDVDLTRYIHSISSLEIPQKLPSLSSQLYQKALRGDDSFLIRDISFGNGLEIKTDIRLSDYLALRSQNHRVAFSPEYGRFLIPHSVINDLSCTMTESSSSPEQAAQQILDYVHGGIIYNVSIEKEKDYVRHPLETIVEGNGDCEDTTILGAALSRARKLDVILVHFGPPFGSSEGHIGYAVAGDFHGTYFMVEGKKYFYAETTATFSFHEPAKWKIGQFPRGYEHRVIDIYTLHDAVPSKIKEPKTKKHKSQRK